MQTATNLTKTKWLIDPLHSEIGFVVKHLMFTNVKGVFEEYNAKIYTIDDDFLTVEINVSINPASINTHIAQRDADLRSPNFFEVETFKEIIFTSKSFKAVDKKATMN